MKDTYKITGMTCNGCKSHVQNILESVKEIESVTINLEETTTELEIQEGITELVMVKGLTEIVMSEHIPLDKLQKLFDGSNYMIHSLNEQVKEKEKTPKGVKGIYYCPMHCEGEKTYDKSGDCPVCGMDLVAEATVNSTTQFTCPMHPEVIKDEAGACPKCGMDLVPMQSDESEEQKSYRKLLKKFWVATAFTLPIFLIAMSEMIPNNPLYYIMDIKYWNWLQFGLSIPVVFYATWMFFKRAYTSIRTMNLNMFTLIGIGAGVAWLFSFFGLLFPDLFPDAFKTEFGTVHVYFEAATVILTLVLLGQLLEAKAHSKTNNAVKELLKLAPNKAIRIENGEEIEISIDDIKVGDLLRVKPGDKIPVDGKITDGKTSVDESMISGEPIPVDKEVNDKVTSGTINGKQSFVMKAEKVGADTLLSQIIHMVNNASRSKAPIQKLADKISGYFVPVVIVVSIITFIVWKIVGPEPSLVYAFVNAIAVLIIACPCALGLATPMSVMVGVGKGAQEGVLIKDAESLEKMNKVDVLIIDKTGTVTEGKPSVEKIVSLSDYSENELTQFVASVNKQSEHPLAEATVRFAEDKKLDFLKINEFDSITGKGVKAIIKDKIVLVGNEKLLLEHSIVLNGEIAKKSKLEQEKGKTVPFIAIDNELVGFVVISDAIKETSRLAINTLKNKGVKVIMMTGDNRYTAKAVAEELELDDYYADCLPEDKLNKVKELQEQGHLVAMAGDGINDAPALALANVGIAMGTGTDVAIESSAITLVKGDLHGIVKAKTLSHKVMRNIKQNLFFALAYNVIGIPIAAGVLYPVFGLLLSPMIAALAMSFSSVSVIANALRLRTQSIK
ncbi:MAG: heavy metal translocating P-type ATPase [Flavobacteriaceae bacterium]